MYIYHIAVVIDGDEDLQLEYNLEKRVVQSLKCTRAEYVSSWSEVLDGQNYGRCTKCGAWTSDWTKKMRISSFSNGAQVNGEWFCDLCLPEDHPNHF